MSWLPTRSRLRAVVRCSARRRLEGLTIVEVCAIVCVAGVVLAVFVPTFLGHLRTSKVSEASEELERMHDGAAAYWLSRPLHAHGDARTHCLPAAAGPAPEHTSIDPVDVDFGATATPGATTWRALGFVPGRPTRFQYTFAPARTGCGIEAPPGQPVLVMRAEGDLDGDGARSTFERRAGISRTGELVPVDILYVVDRIE